MLSDPTPPVTVPENNFLLCLKELTKNGTGLNVMTQPWNKDTSLTSEWAHLSQAQGAKQEGDRE